MVSMLCSKWFKEICQRMSWKKIISTSSAAVIRPKLLQKDDNVTSVVIPLLVYQFPTLINKTTHTLRTKRNRGRGWKIVLRQSVTPSERLRPPQINVRVTYTTASCFNCIILKKSKCFFHFSLEQTEWPWCMVRHIRKKWKRNIDFSTVTE